MVTLNYICERIEGKKLDNRRYAFTETEDEALRVFFELAQEFEGIEDLYLLCVAIPKNFFGLVGSLYLVDARSGSFGLVSATGNSAGELGSPPPEGVVPAVRPYCTAGERLVLTIRGNERLLDQLPFEARNGVIGLMELGPLATITPHDELFFDKFANRVGFNVHNRFLAEKNAEHLRFVRTLVQDIEHNVIVPNMVFKLFLRRLKGKISKNVEIENLLEKFSAGEPCDGLCLRRLQEEMIDVNRGMIEEYDNLEKHYKNITLFLETLLRGSHFDQGRLTLRTKLCNMKRDVVQPQLQRFAEQFSDLGIVVDDRLSGLPDEEVIAVVDVGLLAQVYANLFSNALKYTQEITTHWGAKQRYISYGRQLLKDYFGPGKDGIKYNVFSTGPHIRTEDRGRIFEEQYRGIDVKNKPGTGHGLAFVKNVIEIHGGVVGYEPTQYGNNFYFIIPK